VVVLSLSYPLSADRVRRLEAGICAPSTLTRYVLITGITGHSMTAVVALFLPQLIHQYLWPPPLEQVPDLWLRFDGAVDLALACGGIYALLQNSWTAGRTFLFTSGGYVAFLFVATLIFLLTVPDQPLVLWLYILLAFLYLPLILVAWRQESARTRNHV
jgi:hypothetical protein